jgi:hypothetical protein
VPPKKKLCIKNKRKKILLWLCPAPGRASPFFTSFPPPPDPLHVVCPGLDLPSPCLSCSSPLVHFTSQCSLNCAGSMLREPDPCLSFSLLSPQSPYLLALCEHQEQMNEWMSVQGWATREGVWLTLGVVLGHTQDLGSCLGPQWAHLCNG